MKKRWLDDSPDRPYWEKTFQCPDCGGIVDDDRFAFCPRCGADMKKKKTVAISCGPIPAKLDSVKFVTNRFKGGLAFKTAVALATTYEVTVVKWVHTPLPLPDGMDKVKVVNVSDVFDYYKWFEANATEFDAFVMAAAVANLVPSEPYEGKFPSHNYEVGERFEITFEIAPNYCISGSSVDYDGYTISSKGFLPTVVDIMII